MGGNYPPDFEPSEGWGVFFGLAEIWWILEKHRYLLKSKGKSCLKGVKWQNFPPAAGQTKSNATKQCEITLKLSKNFFPPDFELKPLGGKYPPDLNPYRKHWFSWYTDFCVHKASLLRKWHQNHEIYLSLCRPVMVSSQKL